MSSPEYARRAPFAAALAFILAAAPACARAWDEAPFEDVPLRTVRDQFAPGARVELTPSGLQIVVVGSVYVELPAPAPVLELEVEASGPVLLTWAARGEGPLELFKAPWRYRALPKAPETLRLDLRQTHGWTSASRPALHFKGEGVVRVRSVRAQRGPALPWEVAEGFDRANFWAPQSVGFTTINSLDPPYWRASRREWLADRLALAGGLALVAVLVGFWLVRRQFRPGLALAVAALLTLLAWDAHFLIRYLPALRGRIEVSSDDRIRDNYYFAPDLGALLAVARATVRPEERVGVIGEPDDWLGRAAVCFNLAPRKCVMVVKGEERLLGLSNVDALSPGELDAIVSYRGGRVPPGFVAVAASGPVSWVARRP